MPVSAELLAEMEARDDPGKLRGTDGRLWKSKITHLQPHPALPANKEFSLEFDRPLTEHTSVLYRTDMTIEWEVVDANGVTVTPDAAGTIKLSADQDYEVRAHIDCLHPNADLALFGELDRIPDQICQNLTQTSGIANEGCRQIYRQRAGQLYSFAARHFRKSVGHLLNDCS